MDRVLRRYVLAGVVGSVSLMMGTAAEAFFCFSFDSGQSARSQGSPHAFYARPVYYPAPEAPSYAWPPPPGVVYRYSPQLYGPPSNHYYLPRIQ